MPRDPLLIAVTKEDTNRNDVLDAIRCARDIQNILKEKYDVQIMGITREDFVDTRALVAKLKSSKAVCIFNLFEGFSDDSSKEAAFVRALEKTGVPFTGNRYKAVLNCLDKAKSKRLIIRAGVRVPQGICVKSGTDKRLAKLNYPLFLKPCCEDASVGIGDDSLVKNKKELTCILSKMVKSFPQGIVVEQFIAGCEYSCAFLGNGPYEFVGISMIDYKKFNEFKPFLTYKAKWDIDSREFKAIIPTVKESLDKTIKSSIIKLSKTAAQALLCRGYFRVDLREVDGQLYVLDVNPNPDINIDSGFVRQAMRKGYSFKTLIHKIVRLALR